MYILGLESSCDETSAAIVSMDDSHREICANIVASQIETKKQAVKTHFEILQLV